MCVSAPELHQRLKTNLFVEAEKLTVSYPTVQHAVDMDVVGLQEKMEINTAALPVSQYKQSKATAPVPEHGFYDFYVSFFVIGKVRNVLHGFQCNFPFRRRWNFQLFPWAFLSEEALLLISLQKAQQAGWSAKHTPTDVSEEW